MRLPFLAVLALLAFAGPLLAAPAEPPASLYAVAGELPPPPIVPRESFDPSKPTVVLVTAYGCPPCETAATVAAEAEAAGVQVLVVNVELGGAQTPTWYGLDLASGKIGPLDADRVAALAMPPEIDRGFSTVVPAVSKLPGSPPLAPGERVVSVSYGEPIEVAPSPATPRQAPAVGSGRIYYNRPGCAGGSCPRR